MRPKIKQETNRLFYWGPFLLADLYVMYVFLITPWRLYRSIAEMPEYTMSGTLLDQV